LLSVVASRLMSRQILLPPDSVEGEKNLVVYNTTTATLLQVFYMLIVALLFTFHRAYDIIAFSTMKIPLRQARRKHYRWIRMMLHC